MSTESRPAGTEKAVHYYAIRRVNPFLGVLQVIETDAGRALSANGVAWEIEVRAERPGGWGSLNRGKGQPAYYRYGLWSLQAGLVNRPLAPHLDADTLTRQCQQIITSVREHLEKLPFPLMDQHELWLFDRAGCKPLALLASATKTTARASPEPKYWSAGLGTEGVPGQRRFVQAQALEMQVKQAAGFNLRKHWVYRSTDGSSVIEGTDIEMDSGAFPPYLLMETWPDVDQERLARDYIHWVAPSLLTLQQLGRDKREHLEKHLHIQAVSVEHHWHLYPEIIDNDRLRAALVQCRLQHANQDAGGRSQGRPD
jgi:hypothetical protein